MNNSSISNSTRRHPLIFALLQVVFFVLLFSPDILLLGKWVPVLLSPQKLQANLLRGSGYFIDAAKYYACAEIAKTDPQNIWNLSAQQNWFKEKLGLPVAVDLFESEQLSPAQYTPQAILMFMPFTLLPLNQAIISLELLSLLVFIFPMTSLLLRYKKMAKSEVFIWWLFILSAASVTENFFLGQSTFILAGLAAIFLLHWQNKNDTLAAIALALTIAIKPHRAFVFIIMLLATKKYRLLLTTLLYSVFLLFVAIVFFGLAPVMHYPQALIAIESAVDEHKLLAPTSLIVSIFAPISILWGRHAARLASLPLLFVCLLLIFVIWRKAFKYGEKTYPFAYTCALLFNLILGPHEHFYDLVLLSTTWAMTIPSVHLDQVMLIKNARLWNIVFLIFPALTWFIYLICSHFPSNYFGPWHLPLLIIMLMIAFQAFQKACLKDQAIIKAPD